MTNLPRIGASFKPHRTKPLPLERGDGVSYYNTGDWVENCTAIVEHADGRQHLLSSPA